MKLTSLTVNDFRGFAGEHRFDLDAEAVILLAANGQGKTSFFDAILWGLTGLLPRLGETPRLLSLYSETGEARIELVLGADDGKRLHISRRDPGGLSVEFDGKRSEGASATALVHSLLWPAAEHAPDGDQALAGALTRSVYLQQDLVRDFIEGDDDKARFAAVSELAGAGRVTELAVELESARRGWSRATNLKVQELDEAKRKLAEHQAQLDALGSVDVKSTDDLAERWDAWWGKATSLDPGTAERKVASPSGMEGASALEGAMRLLESARRASERRLIAAEVLQGDLGKHALDAPPIDLSKLAQEVKQVEAELATARQSLAVAEQAATERRRKQVEAREAAEELGALAELALRHIEGSCPVCGQQHDQAKTRAHLQQLIETSGSAISEDNEDEVRGLAKAVQGREDQLSAVQAKAREAEGAERDAAVWKSERDERLRELGLDTSSDVDIEEALQSLITKSRETRDAIDVCEAEGERLSVEIAGASERARAQELKSTIDAEQIEVSDLLGVVEARQRTGALASQMLEALRDASASVVDAELKRIDPLLQRIYSTADPHPCFRAIRLLSSVTRGRGRLSAAIDDRIATLSVNQPEEVLSSSQLNALAVSVFLALNLGLPSVPLPVAMLDDPLQSLDDVNLLGLVDLLRRTKGSRQLILSTHDPRFGALLARKLRPVGDDGPTRVIELEGWGRRGPSIREGEPRRDTEPLRIAV
jgi:DNA repair exonuclease SbcCD ATPase subunit